MKIGESVAFEIAVESGEGREALIEHLQRCLTIHETIRHGLYRVTVEKVKVTSTRGPSGPPARSCTMTKNQERAARARKVLVLLEEIYLEDHQTNLVDFLADAWHAAEEFGLNVPEASTLSAEHYFRENLEERES